MFIAHVTYNCGFVKKLIQRYFDKDDLDFQIPVYLQRVTDHLIDTRNSTSKQYNYHAFTRTMTTYTSHRNTGVNKAPNSPILKEE